MEWYFPWFNRVLNPNDKSHWRVKAIARIKQKSDAYYIAKESPIPPIQELYNLEIIFCSPNNRQRDLDNCLAACKGIFDGIAMGWKVNDKQFRFNKIDFGDNVKDGKIIVRLA